MMFSFALLAQTSWQPINEVLDGDVPFDIDGEGRQTRISRWTGTAWHLDGIHMRRMWEMNNPVVAVRAALDPATKLSNERTEEGLRWVDVTLKEGDKFSIALDERTRLPARVRWSNPHNNFGELTFATYLEGYAPIAGILLPMSYVTKTDWRNVDYFQVYVDNYEVDSKIDDLSANWATRLAPQAEYDADDLRSTRSKSPTGCGTCSSSARPPLPSSLPTTSRCTSCTASRWRRR